MVGMGMDFARCEGEKVGLETPELVGIPNFIRGRSSETALSSPGLLTHGPARGSKQNLLLHPPLFGRVGPVPEGFAVSSWSEVFVQTLSRRHSGPPCVPREATPCLRGRLGCRSRACRDSWSTDPNPSGLLFSPCCSCSAL